MKLIGTEIGRVLALLPGEEIRSVHGQYPPDAVRAVTERYKFRFPPDISKIENLRSGILTFLMGQTETPDGSFAIHELQVHKDAISVICHTTDAAERFLSDYLAWTRETLSMRAPMLDALKFYSSTVVVQFEVPPEKLFRDYQRLTSLLLSPLTEIYGINVEINLTRLTISADPLKVANSDQLTQYNIERRVSQPYDRELLHCTAPLPTDRHIRLLEDLERLIAHDLGQASPESAHRP